MYLGLSFYNTQKIAIKNNKRIPDTQIARSECLLEGQHWFSASENISVKVFAMWNLMYFTFREHPTDLKCYFSQHVTIHHFIKIFYFSFAFLCTNVYKHICMCMLIQTTFRAVLIICWILPFVPLILDLCICLDFSEFTLNQLPDMGVRCLLRCSLLSHLASSGWSREAELPGTCQCCADLSATRGCLKWH